jgi:hypothetical protein
MTPYVDVYLGNSPPPNWCFFCHRDVDTHYYNERGSSKVRTVKEAHANDCIYIEIGVYIGRIPV